MSTRTGEMQQVWTVQCAGPCCVEWAMIAAKVRAACEKELREDGWRKVGGLWYCPRCAVKRH